MESSVVAETAVAIVFVGLAMLLGYLGQRGWMGAAILGFAAAFASVLCIAGTFLGLRLAGHTGGWAGLITGVILAGILIPWLLAKLIGGRSRRFIAGLWFGFCTLCIWGYLAGGWVGLLAITLPAVALFWIGLYRVSAYILPLRGKQQHGQALRCLLTLSLGTNYPYYYLQDGKSEKRVDGNPFLQLFAGPGIVHTNCDHAVYLSDDVSVKGVFEPGVNFTGLFDLPPKVLDLRPQLRAFDVDVRTKDGIPIKVLVFIPFRVRSGNQRVELGKSFPFSRRAAYDIVAGELVERKRKKEEGGERHAWNGRLVPLIATPIVQDIIGRYEVDELCAPLEPDRDPRVEIAAEMRARVRKALQPRGIEVIGGGMSNLIPQEGNVIKRRLESWQTEWERKILLLRGECEAERAGQIETARADAEAEIVLRLGQIVERSGDVPHVTLALRFIDCLGELVSQTDTQWPLPKTCEETLKRLRGEIEEGQR